MSEKNMSRRDFIKKASALVGIGLVVPSFFGPFRQLMTDTWEDTPHGIGGDDQEYDATNVIHTVCQQCNSSCTVRALMVPGDPNAPYSSIVRKMAGNSYSPLNTIPYGQQSYLTSPSKVITGLTTAQMAVEGRGFRGGRTCLKGQAGIQTAYDQYRIRTPLRRVGSRGSGRWESITWEQVFKDIIEGNKELGTPGLQSIWAYVPKETVMADWKKVQDKQMEFAEFDKKYRDVLIDTHHPDAGPKANQIVGFGGDRRDFATRFFNSQAGTVNFFDHSSVCGASSGVGNAQSYEVVGKKVKKRLASDIENTEFLIVWGTDPLVSSKSPTYLAPKITNALARGMKMAVIEPRMSKTSEKATMWIPIEPGQDAALALGMARWIIENKRYDEKYLRLPNMNAAKQAKEPTWSDATYLVNLDAPGKPLLTVKDAGLGDEEAPVVMVSGTAQPSEKAMVGDLEFEGMVAGKHVQTVFTMFKKRVMGKTLEQYSQLSTVPVKQIAELAGEFTSHGKKASIMAYRGPAMHANGFQAVRAINMLNHLIGNADWKGGSLTGGAAYKEFDGRYNLQSVPKANKAWGIPIDRNKSVYEKSSYFKKDGYPAKRRWYPAAGAASYDVLPSAAEGYPYPIKAMFISRVSPVLSFPNGKLQESLLKDQKVVPLLVVSDIVMGETAAVADYVLPDLSYLERFGREGLFENLPWKVSTVGQPVTRVVPDAKSIDDVYIEIAKRMNWPGVGDKAFVGGGSLHRAEDFYLKRIANIAFDGKPVPDASREEMTLFEKARKNALGKYFVIDEWKKAVKPEEWRKVVFVMNRGGRFEASDKAYTGDYLTHQWGHQVKFYANKVAGMKNSANGEFFDGLPDVTAPVDYKGVPMKETFPLKMINWKSRNLGTHRNMSNAWLREIRNENYLWMNSRDAVRRGLKTGDRITIQAPNYKVEGEVLVTEMIKPGTVGAAFNYGHTQYGASSYIINGKITRPPQPYQWTPFDLNKPQHEELGFAKGRGEGFSVNNLLALDPSISNACYADIIGGSPAQFDLYVDVKKSGSTL
ncbi:molybdopterin-dependent oxidoreductase [Aneurinibacillus terranovensis]|uniref:molybdopterin-dependent oxidoreductase n=1 Tax=Aneurinibacillus terranovensis TaxID=278991 RepID=UPI00040A9CE0|nr:molybdopterin-dependent oxidoreductase [Aneurinibacillus terranovensis]